MLHFVRDKINTNFIGGFVIIKDGKEYARVSEILAPFNDFSAIDPEVLANKCRIGTQVHEAIAAEIAGEFPILAEDSWGYFKSFLRWLDEMNPFFEQSEQRYFSKRYTMTGQIDALVSIGTQLYPTLIDFKTSAQESTTWRLQAHMYGLLLGESEIKHQPRYLFIKLDKMGGLPQVFQYKYDSNVMAKCLNAICL